MDCTECGRTNRRGAKFCAGCATAIVAPCASCGQPLAPDSHFCDQCGAPVHSAAATPAATSTRTDDAVRKTVTVLFCDLAGSTALEERVDAESSRDILGRYHSMVESVVVASGGTVAKFIGDGAMALFGIPEVAVDDAERGVAAGLELQRRFLALRTHITGRFDVDVGLRVGVNTGEVVIADADADLVGDALNVAARIEAACAPGDVLVGEDTWRVTRAAVAYESFGMLELRGKQEAVAAYRAVDLLAEVDESATPFVGRDGELDRLRTAFDEAVTTNSVKLATVIGAPGVGKTRLSRELERALHDEATVIELRCERAGGTTFAPITDLLRIVGEIDDSVSADEAIERLTALVDGLDDSDRVGSLLASFTGATPMRSTEEAFFAVRRLIESMGRQRPVAIVIDDIQWAEALFLDLLEHLAEWGRDSPALLLGLARPELREIRPSLAEVGRRVSESIALEGLDAEATAELAGLLVGTDSLPADLLARLPESTEGNPLFVRELMKMLIDDDVIVETDRGWELAIDADAVEVPPTIQSLLSSRIERMPDDERYLVELAAVVGPEFPLGAVAAIDASGDSATLIATLERLRRKELVEPTGTYWGDEPLFRFHHVLIRDAAYRRLLKGRRADLHLRVADWIENVGASDVGEQQVTVGYHLEQAHDYRTQLDIADDETVAIGRRAAEMLGAAAERALARDDVAAAGSLAVRAVARLNDDAEAREDLLMLGCEALFSLGDVAAAVPLLKELRGASAENARLAAWTRSFEAQLVLLTDPERLEEAERESATAAADLAALDDHAGEANARLVRAGALARLGRIGECEAELDSALGAARAADDGRRVAAVLGAAPVAALWGPSPVSRAGGRCLDVIRLLRITTGSPGVEATSTRCQAVLEALRGRFDTARTMLGEALATVEELGLRHGWLETQLYYGIVELLAGDPEAAEPHLRSAYGGLGRLGIGADAGQAAAHLSRALLLQGRLDEADELATDSEALAGQNPQTAIAAKTARAEILAARGEVVEALRLAEEAVALAEGTDIVIDHANANVALARVRAAAGDADGARAARRAAEELFTAKGASVDLVEFEAVEAVGTQPASEPSPPEASAEPPPAPGEIDQPWNKADEVARRLYGIGRPTAQHLLEHLATDVEFDNSRRTLHHARIVGAESLISAFARIGWFDEQEHSDTTGEIEQLAARGEHLILLLRRQWLADDPERAVSTRIELVRFDDDDRIDLMIHFDESDLAEALTELDRLYLDGPLDLATRFLVPAYADAYGANSRGDVDGVLARMDNAYVHHDHQPLGWGELDLDGMRARFSSLAGVDGTVRSYVARFRERQGPVDWTEAHIRVSGPTGAMQVDRQHLVNVFDPSSGLNVRTDRYDDDQLDQARAKFEETVHASAEGRTPWNTAVQVGGIANTWAARGEWERFSTLLATDVTVEADGEPLVPDTEDLRDPLVAGRCGFGVEHRRVLAVRGERLVLAELRDEGADEPFHRIVLEEIDDDCRLARITHFAPTALGDAARHLEVRWLDLDGSSHGDVIRTFAEFSHARAVADTDRLRALLADDCRFADHRFPGLPGNDMSWLFDMIDAESADGTATTGVGKQLLAVNGRGYLGVLQPWRSPASGPLEEHGLPILTIGQVTDGRVSALEFFPDDQFDAARARFEELTGEPEVIDDEPWNAADALMRHLWPAIANQDNDLIVAMTTADIVRHDRRRLHGVTEQGRADAIAALGAFERGSSTFEVETIATRGDRLVLQRADQRDPDNNVLYGLNIARLDGDGLVDLDVTFDPEDMDAALAELDQLWSEADEADEVFWSLRRHWDAWAVHATEGAATGNWSHAMGYMDPRLEMIDHRSIGWPALDYEGFRNRLESVTAMDGTAEITVPIVHAIDGLVSVATMVMRLREPNGAEHVDRSVLVSTSSPESSQAISHEQFAGHDLEAAMRRFRAIVRARADDRSLSNAATMSAARAHRWVSLRLDPFETIIAPHAVIVNERGDALLEDRADLEAVRDAGLGAVEHRVLAVRGQRLALVELHGSDAEDHRFAVVEIDERAWITRLTLFDGNTASLAAAADLLDERWLETEHGGPTDAQRFAVRLTQMYRRGPLDELDEIFVSDALLTDRRPLGWKPIRYDDWVGVVGGSEITDRRGVPIVSEFRRITDDGLAFSSSHLDITDDHELVEMLEGVHLMAITEGQITVIEVWPSDDLDGALARFTELVRARSAPEEHEPLNRADALGRRFFAAQASGTVETLADAYEPELVLDDRRRLHHVVHRGWNDCLAWVAHSPFGGTKRSALVATVATRGDRLVLHRNASLAATDLTGPLLQNLTITRLSEAGTGDLGVMFDDEDLDAAMAELDRLWDELDETNDAFTFAALTWSQWETDANWAWSNELDFTRALAHQDERLRLVDHREIGWPVVDFDGFKERLESFRRITASGGTTIPWLHVAEGLLSLAVMQNNIVESSGAEHVDRNLWLARLSPETGQTIATEQFPIEELSAAMTRFRELATEQQRDAPLWNVASLAANRAHSWSRAGHPIAGIVANEQFIVEDADGNELPIRGGLDDPDTARRLGFGVDHRRVLAVRGERLALMELRHESGEDVFHRVATVEIDHTGRISRIRLFEVDSLLEAAQYLGSRWLEVDRPEHQSSIELSLDFPNADASGDWDHLADDCAFVDHRPLSFGRGDKAWMVEMSKSREGIEGTRLNPRILGWNERGTYATVATWIKSRAGELVQGATSGIGVRQVTAGRVSAIEVFPDNDLDSARSRFEELTAEPPPEQAPWNAADALARRVLQAYANGEIDRAADDLDPTVRIESRRFAGATHAGTADKDESLSRLRDRPVFPESTDLHLDTIATRGDHLVLLRAEYRQTGDADGPTIDMLILVRLTADGLADLGIAWETDDLEQVIAELDRLYLEHDPGPAMAVALRGWTEAYDVPRTDFSAADGEGMMLNLDSDLRMVDHRAIGWPEQNFEAFRERIRSLVDLDAELSFVVARVRRVDGVRSLVELVMTVTSREGAVQTDRNLLIAAINPESGLTVRNDQFGADDIDAAEEFFDARANELAALDSVGNTASWLSNRAHTWARAAAWERAASLFAEDVVIDDDVGAVLHAGHEAVADARAAARVGFGVEDRRVLAVRGEQLALMEWRDDDLDGEPFRRFVVVELNRRAEFTRIRLFDWTTEGLKAAADHLDDRYGAIEELSEVGRLGIEFVHAFRHRDRDRLATVLDERYSASDHRSLGWPDFDRDGWLELFDAPEDVPVVTIVGRVLSTTESGLAVRMSQWSLSDDNLAEALPGNFVTLVEDGLFVRSEGLPPDDPRAAAARLAELTEAAAQPSEQEPWNDADRRSRQALSDFEHDVEVWRATLAPDIEYHDMRPVVGGTFRGPAEVEEALAPGFVHQLEVETIATRGNRLVLLRSLISTTGSGAGEGIEMEFLILHRWSEPGLLELTELFDPDDLDRAIAEIDRLYLEIEPGPTMYATMRGIRQRLDAYMSDDPQDPPLLLDPDFEFVDHRELGWPTLDRDTNRQRRESMSDFVDRFVFLRRIHRAEGPIQLFELEARIADKSGASYTHRSVLLHCTNPQTGLSRRQEQFDLDELENAFARFDELRDEVVAGGLANTAASLTAFTHSQMRSDRWEVALDLLAESVGVTRHDGAVVASGRDELSDPEAARRVGFGARDRRVLAVRGDRLALMEWRDDDLDGSPFQEFALVELNERAELSRVTVFDWTEEWLIAAAGLLDDRWVELGGIDEASANSPVFEIWRAFSRHDGRRLFELVSDDADIWDRRPLGWPPMGKAEWFEATNKVPDLRGVPVVGRILSIGDSALVVALSHWSCSDSGELTEMLPGIYLTTSVDGQIDLVEVFPPDDEDVAIMRLAELTTGSPPSGSTNDGPWNEADRLTQRFVGRLVARDVDAYAIDVAEDVVLDDRRQLIRSIHRGRDEVMAVSAPGIYPAEHELVANVEIIACRGHGFALHHCEIRVVGDHSGPTMEWLSVTEWGNARLTRAVLFDPNEYLGAIDELDSMFLETCDDDAERMLIDQLGASYRAISLRDPDRVQNLGHPDFTMTDHRGIGWPDLDSDGFRERIRSIMDIDADLASFVVRFHRANRSAFMAEGCHRVALASGAVQIERHLGVVALDIDSGLARHFDFFDVEQFDEAVALHTRLTEQVEAEHPLRNTTTILANRANYLARLRRWHVFAETVADDVRIENSDGRRLVESAADLPGAATAKRVGLGVESRHVLAVRGERLALVELRDPDVVGEPFHRFTVEETNREQQLVRVALYEPHELADAADDFDRRWLALDDSEHGEALALINRNVSAFRHLDVVAAAETMAPDFTFVDHRPMGYPTFARDGYLAALETVGDAHGIVVGTEEGHSRAAGLVSPIVNLSVSAGGELVENQVAVAMIHVHDGLVTDVEFFPIDDEDAALDRLDHLAAE